MRSSIYWGITLCSSLKYIRRFGGTCSLNLECRRISQARNQREAVSKESILYAGFLLGLLVYLEDRADTFLRNVGLTFNVPHGMYTELFITTTVGISNPTPWVTVDYESGDLLMNYAGIYFEVLKKISKTLESDYQVPLPRYQPNISGIKIWRTVTLLILQQQYDHSHHINKNDFVILQMVMYLCNISKMHQEL
jgi:phosphate starvation-inducible membrane PsiE